MHQWDSGDASSFETGPAVGFNEGDCLAAEDRLDHSMIACTTLPPFTHHTA
jgi:hypothetical protein